MYTCIRRAGMLLSSATVFHIAGLGGAAPDSDAQPSFHARVRSCLARSVATCSRNDTRYKFSGDGSPAREPMSPSARLDSCLLHCGWYLSRHWYLPDVPTRATGAPWCFGFLAQPYWRHTLAHPMSRPRMLTGYTFHVGRLLILDEKKVQVQASAADAKAKARASELPRLTTTYSDNIGMRDDFYRETPLYVQERRIRKLL